MTAIAINFQDFIQVQNNQAVTTSEFVAKAFEKRHADVLRKIDELLTQVPDYFSKRNFAPTEKTSKQTFGERIERAYELTKDGFMLLVMGFTGKAAMQIKIAYIQAFNAMAETLKQQASVSGKDLGDILGECFAADAERRAQSKEVAVPKKRHTTRPETEFDRNTFEKLAKVCAYAGLWHDMQKLLCTQPDHPQAQHIFNTVVKSTNVNQSGFLFVFSPDAEKDIRFVSDWLHKQSWKVMF